MPVNQSNIDKIHESYNLSLITNSFAPAVYVIEPTSVCNINCVTCPNSRLASHHLGYMKEDVLEKTIDLIEPYAELVMFYFMGEPLLHHNFTNIVAKLRKKIKGRIVLSTNMTKLEDEHARAILENFDIVLCSIDPLEQGGF